jgi:ABC-type transport system substrate-binding protein
MGLSNIAINVHATPIAPGTTTFNPFGPYQTQLIFTDYSDFSAMFNNFAAGQIDVTDWPVFSNLLSGFQGNPDMAVTNSEPEFGMFQLDINSHWTWLGVANEITRVKGTAGTIGTPTTVSGCVTGTGGFGHLTVNLVNVELAGSPAIFDSNNALTILGGPGHVFTVQDTGVVKGGSPTGAYDFGSPTTCAPSDTYTISTSVYSGSTTVSIPSNGNITLTLGVNYNSISPVKLTDQGTAFRRAMAHLLSKATFVKDDTQLAGIAICDDLQSAVPQGIGNGCSGGPLGNTLPASVRAAECPFVNIGQPTFSCSTANPPPTLFNLNITKAITPGQYWWATGAKGAGVVDGLPSIEDLHAACDYIAAAGFSVVNGNCAAVASSLQGSTAPACATVPSGTPNNCAHLSGPAGKWIVAYVRSHQPRKHFGQIIADGLNALFGTPQSNGGGTICYGALSPNPTTGTCSTSLLVPTYYTFGQIVNVIYGDGFTPDVWNFYTAGYTTDTVPDQPFTTYSSNFAGQWCGGAAAQFPPNEEIHCDPAYDSQALAGEFAATKALGGNLFLAATTLGSTTVTTIPVYTPLVNFAALNGFNYQGPFPSPISPPPRSTTGSLVAQKGNGWEAGVAGTYWTNLNARQVENYAPANSIYTPGCTSISLGVCTSANPDLIRSGMSQDTDFLTLFSATSVWDFSIINSVYDTMLTLVPRTGGLPSATDPGYKLIDWMTVSHSESISPTEVSCLGPPINPTPVCYTGTTTQTWQLRPDLKFHDGTAVLADDAAYSLLACRDVPCALLAPFVSNIATATCPVALPVSPGPCPVAPTLIPGASAVGNAASSRTLQVKLILSSPLYELNVGNDINIIPKHVWQPVCGPMPLAAGGGPCSNPAVDPMCPNAPTCNAGYFIGSGPFVCTGVTGTAAAGHVGGSCNQNADGSLGGQTTSVGGRVLLTANPNYMRGPTRLIGSNYQLFSWADEANTGTVDINDLAKAAVNFCKNPAAFPGPGCPADAYFGNPLLGVPGQVNINDIATIATYFDVSLTSPIAPSQVLGLDSVIDYFDPTGDTAGIFLGCVVQSATQLACYTDSPPVPPPLPPQCPPPWARSGNQQANCEAMSIPGLTFASHLRSFADPYHPGYNQDIWLFNGPINPVRGNTNIFWTPGCATFNVAGACTSLIPDGAIKF